MISWANTVWIEQATGLDIAIGPMQEETRSVVISVRPTVHEDRVFRVFHIAGVVGSTLFADEATWDESAITGFIADGVLMPVPTPP